MARSLKIHTKSKEVANKNHHFPRFSALFGFRCIFVDMTMGYHKNQTGASNSTWYSRYDGPKFENSHKIQGGSKQKSPFPMISATGKTGYYLGLIRNPGVCMYVCMYVCIAEIVSFRFTSFGLPPPLNG